jgi:hypothetical protein
MLGARGSTMVRSAPHIHQLTLLLLACALPYVALAAPVRADVLLTTETRIPGEAERAGPSGRIWLGPDRMRLEFEQADLPGRTAILIFRADLGLYWALDPDQQSYVQIDRETMQRLGERVRQARSEMAARLDTLPVEQREMVEKMIAGMTPPAASTLRETLRPTDRTQQMDGHPARHAEMLLGEEVVGDVWTTSWSGMGIDREDFAVFTELAAFQRELIASLGQAAGAALGGEPFEVFDQLDGYPLQIRRLQGGATESITRFGAPKRLPASKQRFEVPEGYTRRQGPGAQEAEAGPRAPAAQ